MSGITLSSAETNLSRIVRAVIELVQGRSNAVGTVTLTPNVTSTVVVAVNCGKGSKVFLYPQTANAAAALPTTFVAEADVMQGAFRVTHASAVTVDRSFDWIALG